MRLGQALKLHEGNLITLSGNVMWTGRMGSVSCFDKKVCVLLKLICTNPRQNFEGRDLLSKNFGSQGGASTMRIEVLIDGEICTIEMHHKNIKLIAGDPAAVPKRLRYELQ